MSVPGSIGLAAHVTNALCATTGIPLRFMPLSSLLSRFIAQLEHVLHLAYQCCLPTDKVCAKYPMSL